MSNKSKINASFRTLQLHKLPKSILTKYIPCGKVETSILTPSPFMERENTRDDKAKYQHKYSSVTTTEFDSEVFPNPTNAIVTLDRNCIAPLQSYTINDISGQLLFQETNIPPGNDPITINFSQYPTGIYFIRYDCGSIITVYTVIKQG